MDIDKVFDTFCDKLKKRKELMTEDNVRYYWFVAMRDVEGNTFDLNHYTMEFPYDTRAFSKSSLGRKELDLLYDDGEECICMEIKFHRNPDEKSVYAHPDAAGSLFNDLIRLSIFRPGEAYNGARNTLDFQKRKVRRLFLYVTDAEMDAYLSWKKEGNNYREELNLFYNHDADKEWFHPAFYEIDSVTKTFKVTALKSFAKFTKEEDNVEEVWNKQKYPIPNIKLLKKLDIPSTNNQQEQILSPSYRGKACHVRLYEVKENDQFKMENAENPIKE